MENVDILVVFVEVPGVRSNPKEFVKSNNARATSFLMMMNMYLYSITQRTASNRQASRFNTVNSIKIPAIIDSGASFNVLDKNTFYRLNRPKTL